MNTLLKHVSFTHGTFFHAQSAVIFLERRTNCFLRAKRWPESKLFNINRFFNQLIIFYFFISSISGNRRTLHLFVGGFISNNSLYMLVVLFIIYIGWILKVKILVRWISGIKSIFLFNYIPSIVNVNNSAGTLPLNNTAPYITQNSSLPHLIISKWSPYIIFCPKKVIYYTTNGDKIH